MQRITWSGSALHEGPLPGYPASHGCVRLTSELRAAALEGDQDGRPRHRHPPRGRAARVRARPPVRAEAEDGRGAAEAPEPLVKVAAAQRTSEPAGPEPATRVPVANVRIADAANATVVAVLSVAGDDSKAVATSVETVPAANAPGAAQPTKLATTEPQPAEPRLPAPNRPAAGEARSKPAANAPSRPSPSEPSLWPLKPSRLKPSPPRRLPRRRRSSSTSAPNPCRPRVVQEANGRPISVFAASRRASFTSARAGSRCSRRRSASSIPSSRSAPMSIPRWA